MILYLSTKKNITSTQPQNKPYPYGFWNNPTHKYHYSPLQIQHYIKQISKPLLNQIDIHINIPTVKFRKLTNETPSDTESSASIRERVIRAREVQQQRFVAEKIYSNAGMTPRMIRH